MALGEAEAVEDPDHKLAALEAMRERLVPGRWPTLKPPTRQELKATTVVTLALEEVVAKVRSGPPKDEPEDYALDLWAGVVPTRIRSEERRVGTGFVRPCRFRWSPFH